MMQQPVLPYQARKNADEMLTPHAGLAVFGEFLAALGTWALILKVPALAL